MHIKTFLPKMVTVAIESPYAGNTEKNMQYLDECILDCLAHNETPYASHKMLTTALKDSDPLEREQGIKAGLVMSLHLDRRAFYIDLGWSAGMRMAQKLYDRNNIPYEIRRLSPMKQEGL